MKQQTHPPSRALIDAPDTSGGPPVDAEAVPATEGRWATETIHQNPTMRDDDRLFLAALTDDAGSEVKLHLFFSEAERTFTIPPAGDKSAIRFAVGEPGRRSSIWRLWAPPKKDDVYFGTRRNTGSFKVSLHESGDYRIQWVAQDSDAVLFTGRDLKGSRIIAQWERLQPVKDGWSEDLGLLVPTSDIAEVPGDTGMLKDVQWLPPAPPGGVVEFRIVRIEPGKRAYDITNLAALGVFTYVNGFRLAGGEVVLLLAVTSESSQAKDLDELRANALRNIPSGFDRSPSLAPRGMAFYFAPDGLCKLIDLAAPGASPGTGVAPNPLI